MLILAIIGLAVALVLFPTLRCALCHPFQLFLSAVRDLYLYFRRREFNRYATGEPLSGPPGGQCLPPL